MKDSNERIDYIASYISAYEAKIRMLNKEGLFDSAKLFELFAIEVGTLYFGQQLFNLNIETFTFPAVDLISSDKAFFVQVSTAADIPDKIKHTLETIRDSQHTIVKNIKNVKFFVLNNESISNIKNYEDETRIGSIDFNKERDLITTETIIEKAITDVDFQINLYNLLRKEEQSIQTNLSKFKDAIESSKVYLKNIDDKINGEYEINRQKLIDKIHNDAHKNISVQGVAGSGKSALCKKLVKNENCVIFARAERFVEENDINNIWGFNVRETLSLISDKKIIFFIDSLESIADNNVAKLDLLTLLYDYSKDYPLIKIITSCRTSDIGAFLKLEGNYDIHPYEMPNLTKEELCNLAKKYPIINKLIDMGQYNVLLNSPFYINMIVREIENIDDIKDENQFRNHIWENVICRRGQDYKKTIKNIVISRAKTLSVGVNPDNYNEKIVSTLISDGILIKNQHSIRLKYDIFEDICFEQLFDLTFDNCRGDYNEFFKTIKSIGIGVCRRYQIWIENKLLAKSNRDKFLYELCFSDKMPIEWKTQTQIGLVKSRYSEAFFNEYGEEILEKELLLDYIKTVNLYAYAIDSKSLSQYKILLMPIGVGRKCLIHLINKNHLEACPEIIKMCSDYTTCPNIEQESAEECIAILGSAVYKCINDTSAEKYYSTHETVKVLLTAIYRIANYASKFIEDFWKLMKQWYKSNNSDKIFLSKEIIEHTLKAGHYCLVDYMSQQLCSLAEFFWSYIPTTQNRRFPYDAMQSCFNKSIILYGLNSNVDNYEIDDPKNKFVWGKTFLFYLFGTHFWEGLNWAIEFINRSVDTYKNKTNNCIFSYTFYFYDNKSNKDYLGNEKLWLLTAQEHSMPLLISDIIYCIKYISRNFINSLLGNKENLNSFANKLKTEIITKANNIALLTIVSEIGIEFKEQLPGYALDITSNIDLVLHDITRKVIVSPNSMKEDLEKQVLSIMSIPFDLPKRYENFIGQLDLIDYFQYTYLNGDSIIKEKCSNILDYLYRIIPNDKKHDLQYLQISKMDMRKAQLTLDKDNNYIIIEPMLNGAAKKLAETPTISKLDSDIVNTISECAKAIKNKTIPAKELVKGINFLQLNSVKSAMRFSYEKTMIQLIAYALSLKDLTKKDRCQLCKIWIKGIFDVLENHGFGLEVKLTSILFAQINQKIDTETKNEIKKLMLDCILYKGQNGIIYTISNLVHNYLFENADLSSAFFNTIVKLAEDQMNHEKYNSLYFNKNGHEFIPNRQPKLIQIDYYLNQHNMPIYKDNKNQIIQDYLYDEKHLDTSDFDMQKYDISLISYALNCKESILDNETSQIATKFMIDLSEMYNLANHPYNYGIFDTYDRHEIKSILTRDFLGGDTNTQNVLNIMFDKIDFSKYNNDIIELYQEVFASLFIQYFDAHEKPQIRITCERIIEQLETKINRISNENIRKEFYKSLTLTPPKYSGLTDYSKCPSGYSYKDKAFLNNIFSKYGGYNLDDMLITIYSLNMDKLLPEIIIALDKALNKHIENCKINEDQSKIECDWILKLAITKVFLDYSDRVKNDVELMSAYENILNIMRGLGYAEAAVILDEFMTH